MLQICLKCSRRVGSEAPPPGHRLFTPLTVVPPCACDEPSAVEAPRDLPPEKVKRLETAREAANLTKRWHDAICLSCRTRYAWVGRYLDRPGCPRCGANESLADIVECHVFIVNRNRVAPEC